MEVNYPVLAFGYQSRVGKDSCCHAIATSDLAQCFHLGGYRRFAFARALKFHCMTIFGKYGLKAAQDYEVGGGSEHLRDVPLDVIGKTPVEIWIEVGQKMREVYPDVWVDEIGAALEAKQLLLVSDLRFPNEMAAIHRVGGWCVLVRRPGNPVKGSDQFLSESSAWDAVIENDGDLGGLKVAALEVAERYLEQPVG